MPNKFPEEKTFLDSAKKPAGIPGVRHFESLKQPSKNNNFNFEFSMEFTSQQLYDAYSNHPEHVKFIQEYRVKHMEDFLEIDYELL